MRTTPLIDAARVRKDFPILATQVNGKPLIYLDSAATSQKPQAVIDSILRFYGEGNSNVHRGVHALAERATSAFEKSRDTVASFIGAPGSETVVWTRGTTEAVNLVAYSWGRRKIAAGDEILVSQMEHHSNLVPWQLAAKDVGAVLRFIPLREDFTLDMDALRGLLSRKTRLVAVTHMSNVLGTINPIREICDLAHDAGARVMVDAAQSVAHMPLDVQDLDCDFLAFSGHKMLGPTGIGVLYGKKTLLDSMPPFHGGGEMINEVKLQESTFKPVPYKFEAGTPPIAEAIGLGVAIDYLRELGMENVRAHEEKIVSYTLERLGNVEGIRVYGPKENRGGAVSFMMDGVHAHDLATILDSEGIAVRAGHHCAQPLMEFLGVPATTRASFYVYNIETDVDALVRALEKARGVFGLARQTV